jgi:hypothetical protein
VPVHVLGVAAGQFGETGDPARDRLRWTGRAEREVGDVRRGVADLAEGIDGHRLASVGHEDVERSQIAVQYAPLGGRQVGPELPRQALGAPALRGRHRRLFRALRPESVDEVGPGLVAVERGRESHVAGLRLMERREDGSGHDERLVFGQVGQRPSAQEGQEQRAGLVVGGEDRRRRRAHPRRRAQRARARSPSAARAP